MNLYLAVDIGGTKTAISLFDEKGNETFYNVFPTDAKNGFKNVLNKILNVTKEPLSTNKLIAGCIASPGPLDISKGKIVRIATMGWENVAIVKEFEKAFNCKFKLINDCSSGAYGSYVENNKPTNMLYISISTGIGGGLILNDKLYEGKGNAAEVGHMHVNGKGKKCPCGKVDCLELYASGSGIENLYFEETNNKLTTSEIAKEAKKGNKVAITLFDNASNYLIDVLKQIETLLDVDLIIFGGGLIKSKELFLTKVIKNLKTKCVFANEDGKQVIKGAYYYLMDNIK